MKKCPYCAELIQDEAIYCRFCQHELTKTPKVKTKKCPYCAEEIPETDTRCSICGHDLIATQSKPSVMSADDKSQNKAPAHVNKSSNIVGTISNNVIQFDRPVRIEGNEYYNYAFIINSRKKGVTNLISGEDKEVATRFAIEQLFREHGFLRVRLDGENAVKEDQNSPEYEDFHYWIVTLPGLEFYPTEDQIINDTPISAYIDGAYRKISPLSIITDYTDIETYDLQNRIAEEKRDRLLNLENGRFNGEDAYSYTETENEQKHIEYWDNAEEDNSETSDKTETTEQNIIPENTNIPYEQLKTVIDVAKENVKSGDKNKLSLNDAEENDTKWLLSPEGIFSLGMLAYVVSVFFPMASVSFLGITHTRSMFDESWLWIFGFIMLMSVPFGLFEKRLYILSALVCLVHTILPSFFYDMMVNKDYEAIVSHGFGFYLMTVGAVITLCASIYGFVKKRKSINRGNHK